MTDERKFQILEWVNTLMRKCGGTQVGNINGYQNQWLISAHVDYVENEIVFRFCQGRNVGRIKGNKGYPVSMDLKGITSQEEFLKAFQHLNPIEYRRWLHTQPDYIEERKRQMQINIKVGIAKRELRKAFSSGKDIPEKHIKTLRKYGRLESWEKEIQNKWPMRIVEKISRVKELSTSRNRVEV